MILCRLIISFYYKAYIYFNYILVFNSCIIFPYRNSKENILHVADKGRSAKCFHHLENNNIVHEMDKLLFFIIFEFKETEFTDKDNFEELLS